MAEKEKLEFPEFEREYRNNNLKLTQGYFVAYQGNEITVDELVQALSSQAGVGEVVKYQVKNNAFLAKTVPPDNFESRQPLYHNDVRATWAYPAVGSYTYEEAKKIEYEKAGWSLNSGLDAQSFPARYYSKYQSRIFKELCSMNGFSAVIFDRTKRSLIAGVTTSNNAYSSLYYGYTQKEELLFSNSEAVIESFCEKTLKMPNHTYMENGILYASDGTKYSDTLLYESNNRDDSKQKIATLERKIVLLEERYAALLNYFIEENIGSNFAAYLNGSYEDIISILCPSISKYGKNSYERQTLESMLPHILKHQIASVTNKEIQFNIGENSNNLKLYASSKIKKEEQKTSVQLDGISTSPHHKARSTEIMHIGSPSASSLDHSLNYSFLDIYWHEKDIQLITGLVEYSQTTNHHSKTSKNNIDIYLSSWIYEIDALKLNKNASALIEGTLNMETPPVAILSGVQRNLKKKHHVKPLQYSQINIVGINTHYDDYHIQNLQIYAHNNDNDYTEERKENISQYFKYPQEAITLANEEFLAIYGQSIIENGFGAYHLVNEMALKEKALQLQKK